MHPGSTLFLDVCAQCDYWPGGAWPVVDAEEARNVGVLFALAARFGIRQGGVYCAHVRAAPAATAAAGGPTLTPATRAAAAAPVHCVIDSVGATRAVGCVPAQPVAVALAGTGTAAGLDRGHAYYIASGCGSAPDADAIGRAVFDHLTAGVRDAVVFGAGLEYATSHAVEALLRRRVRTHIVLDAAAAADDAQAQRLLAGWKFRGIDGTTSALVARLLTRTAPP